MVQAKKITKNYQALNEELQTIMQDMQRDDLDIDAALLSYERGLQIVQELGVYLQTADNKVQELKTRFGGE